MRNITTLQRAFLWILLLAFTGFKGHAAPAPAPAQEAFVIPKSVFVDDVSVGKDPFFPRSTRRGTQIKESTPVIDTTPDLALKGVSGTLTRKLAIINNKTFEVGEEGELKTKGQSVRVKCVEIKDKSVLIRINGIEKELFLSPR